MEQKSLSSEIYSHPDKLLEDHLVGVARFAGIFLAEKPKHIQDRIRSIVFLSAICHDLGKATKFFQEYINSSDGVKFKTEYSQHSLLSAFMGLYEASKYLDKFDASLVFLAIKHHHGNLNYTVFDFNVNDNDIELLNTQISSIDLEKFSTLIRNVNHSMFKLTLNIQEFADWVQTDLKRYIRELKRL
ncbi:MAG: CRISPR-associated endonuclease Cas3'', partial [Candidatus Kapaibacteriota bacterium]